MTDDDTHGHLVSEADGTRPSRDLLVAMLAIAASLGLGWLLATWSGVPI